MILNYGTPRETARAWLSQAGRIVSWNDTFYRYSAGCYAAVEDRRIRASLDAWLENQETRQMIGQQEVHLPYRVRKDDSLEILDHARTLCYRGGQTPPVWSDGRDASDLLVLEDGILDVRKRELQPHSPELFGLTKLPFRWSGEYPGPPNRFLEFLGLDWGPGEIALLQEYFGYCLANHRKYQKFLLLVGPPRSGKGVILNILEQVVGIGNVYTAAMGTFGQSHADEDLATRQLIMIRDARKSSRTDAAKALEFILTLVGNDEINFPRKYKSNWRGRPRGKLVMATNELLALQDSSDALSSRIIILSRKTSFVEREDPELQALLETELRSIFFWALAGLDRLDARGRFDLSAQSVELRRAFKHLSNPVANFLADSAVLDREGIVTTQALYDMWLAWCKRSGTLNSLRLIQFVAAVRQQAPGAVEGEVDGAAVLRGVRAK